MNLHHGLDTYAEINLRGFIEEAKASTDDETTTYITNMDEMRHLTVKSADENRLGTDEDSLDKKTGVWIQGQEWRNHL